MSWLIVGFGRKNSEFGCEHELPDDEFDTDEATAWLGPQARLSTALWPLAADHLTDVEQLTRARLDPDRMDLFLVRKPHWYVHATTPAHDDPRELLAIDYHLPDGFGFTQAAEWAGRWDAGMAYGSTPLPLELGAEVEESFGTLPTRGRFRHALRSTARP